MIIGTARPYLSSKTNPVIRNLDTLSTVREHYFDQEELDGEAQDENLNHIISHPK